ncbi:MAG: hypothetical protein Ct9H300mP26_4920 [Acidimicrobiales bacterium]|nr:MAG: hypothetical protein Ct9H300mP26_4920 [Acidimicrobiales bacterium]
MSSDLSVGPFHGGGPGPIMRIETPSRCWKISLLRRQVDHAHDARRSLLGPILGAMGRLDWLEDPRFVDPETRAQHGPELMILCDEIFGSADSGVWAERLDAAGMVWGLIKNLEEVIDDPQSQALRAFEHVPDAKFPFRTVSPPFGLDGSEMSVKRAGTRTRSTHE